MNFLADESVDGPIVNRLRKNQHKVAYVAEMDPGISDDQVLEEANRTKAILITADKDFGELVFRQKKHSHGIILIRLSGIQSRKKTTLVSSVIKKHSEKLSERFTVISTKNVRIRSQF